MVSSPGKHQSLNWQYFERLPSGKAKCKTCCKEISCTGGNTSGLLCHLEACHSKLAQVRIYLILDLLLHSLRSWTPGSGNEFFRDRRGNQESGEGSASKRPREDFFSPQVHQVDKELQEKFDEALIEHITETCTSFHQYGESFQRLISVLTKKVKVKHPTSLSRMVDKSAEEVMKEITDIIRTVKEDLVSLGFTTDLWTSRAMDSYLSLTVSFIDRFIISNILVPIRNCCLSGFGSSTDGHHLCNTFLSVTLGQSLP